MTDKQTKIRDLYYDPEQGLTNIDDMYRKLKKDGITKAEIKEFLNKQNVYQLHKKPVRIRHYFPVHASHENQLMQIDLADFSDISGSNNGIKYKCKYAPVKDLESYNKDLETNNYTNIFKNKFFIADVECQPHENDLEPPIGRHEKGKLIWDCAPRRATYTSVDVQTLLNSKGSLYKIHKMLIWDHDTNIFEKWMNKTLEIKQKGEDMNEKVPGSGDAYRAFGKLLGNAAYGDCIRGDHNENVQFIKNIKDQQEFLQENELTNVILDDNEEEGYHVFIGKKFIKESQHLSGRPSYLGAFVVAYSRVLLNNIIDVIYGDDRYTVEGIKKQVYTGDTDSLVVHSSQLQRLIDANMIGGQNGKLTDDLNKKFIVGPNKYQFAKITDFVTSAPKKTL